MFYIIIKNWYVLSPSPNRSLSGILRIVSRPKSMYLPHGNVSYCFSSRNYIYINKENDRSSRHFYAHRSWQAKSLEAIFLRNTFFLRAWKRNWNVAKAICLRSVSDPTGSEGRTSIPWSMSLMSFTGVSVDSAPVSHATGSFTLLRRYPIWRRENKVWCCRH